MTPMEELKTKLNEVLAVYGDGMPVAEAMAGVRVKAQEVLVDFLRKYELWDEAKLKNPGEFLVVTHVPDGNKAEIRVHLSQKFKDLIKAEKK